MSFVPVTKLEEEKLTRGDGLRFFSNNPLCPLLLPSPPPFLNSPPIKRSIPIIPLFMSTTGIISLRPVIPSSTPSVVPSSGRSEFSRTVVPSFCARQRENCRKRQRDKCRKKEGRITSLVITFTFGTPTP